MAFPPLEEQARKELEEEEFRARVEARKAILRSRKKSWFPFKITFKIERI